jgi:hypothetical protein
MRVRCAVQRAMASGVDTWATGAASDFFMRYSNVVCAFKDALSASAVDHGYQAHVAASTFPEISHLAVGNPFLRVEYVTLRLETILRFPYMARCP